MTARADAPKLNKCRILVVEDAYFVADDVRRALISAGAEVIGPAANVAQALTHIAEEDRIDAAILDVNLEGEMSFAVAEALASDNVPFVFATGYDDWALPERWQDYTRIAKPFRPQIAIDVLQDLITKKGPSSCVQ